MRWHRFLKWRCKCGQKNSADQSLRNFGNCFHLTLAVENFEDVVERIGLIFVLSLFLGLFLVEVERRKTGSSALAALLGRLLILVEVQRAGRLVKARGDDGDADLVVERLVERRAEDRERVGMHSLLHEGAAIPANRGQLALLAWNTAGRPAPAGAPAIADVTDPDMAKAAQWCTEQGTMDAKGDRFEPEGWTPKFKVIEVWNKTFPAA